MYMLMVVMLSYDANNAEIEWTKRTKQTYNISSMWGTVEVAMRAPRHVVDPSVVTFKPNHHPLGYPLTG